MSNRPLGAFIRIVQEEMFITQTEGSTRRIVIVSSDPASLPEPQKRKAVKISKELGIRFDGVADLDGFLDSGEQVDAIILVGDDWQGMVHRCSEVLIGRCPDMYPMWMSSALVNGIIGYSALVDCDDLESRIAFLKRKKRIATVFGNCQSRPLREILANHQRFTDDYWIIGMPFVQAIDEKTAFSGFNDILLGSLNLLITMYITEENKYSSKVSTEFMRSRLSEGCRVVVIPNCYFTAYFPQATACKVEYLPYLFKGPDGDAVFPYNDSLAEKAIQDGTDIVPPTNDQILRNLERTITEMITREKRCDITISDYILSNYKKRRLFYTRSHPTFEVLREEIRRLMVLLGYDDAMNDRDVFEIDALKEYIYPEVYAALGLEFIDQKSYLNAALDDGPLDERTYLSLLRLYKRPDSWIRTIGWVSEPFKRSIDFSADVVATGLVRPSAKTLTISDSSVHASFDLVARKDILKGNIVIQVPLCMAPSVSYVTMGRCISGSNVKVLIDRGGSQADGCRRKGGRGGHRYHLAALSPW